MLQILQLERRLKDQMEVRGALEKALGYRPSGIDASNTSSMPKVPIISFLSINTVLDMEC